MLWKLLFRPEVSFSRVGAKGGEAVPSEGGKGGLRAVPVPVVLKALDEPKAPVVPAPPWPNKGVVVLPEPKAGLFVFPKLKVEPVLLPNALLVLLPKPPVEVPKPVLLFVELPNNPPPVFDVLELKGFEAGLLPKREVELLVELPNPVGSGVSLSVPEIGTSGDVKDEAARPEGRRGWSLVR